MVRAALLQQTGADTVRRHKKNNKGDGGANVGIERYSNDLPRLFAARTSHSSGQPLQGCRLAGTYVDHERSRSLPTRRPRLPLNSDVNTLHYIHAGGARLLRLG
jgi:hypothetical protein